MTYRVQFSDRANYALEKAYRKAATDAPLTAARWYHRFRKSVLRLSNNPDRCRIAPEDELVPETIRQFLYGKRPNIYRVLYTIRDDEVVLLDVRPPKSDYATEEELYG